MAPVVGALAASENIDSRVAVTAQHREMLDKVLSLFEITPSYDLDVMTAGQDLTGITTAILHGLRDVLREFQPNLVVVHGDTATTLSAALAAYYQQIPVAHVEAGLRTHDIYSPWPEEVNRKIAGTIATLHFAPTEKARENLLAEGVKDSAIKVTGNTVIDALLKAVEVLDANLALASRLDEELGIDRSKKLVLVTGHRRESFGEGFQRICSALEQISSDPAVQIIYPVHRNPNVANTVHARLDKFPGINLIGPQGYLPFVHLMRRSTLILTDSGGVQEEAPSLGKPVLVMRDHTERLEAVDAGTVRLVGTDVERIVSTARKLLEDGNEYRSMASIKNPYGDGRASLKIAEIIQCLN